jgi:hypothetical protein
MNVPSRGPFRIRDEWSAVRGGRMEVGWQLTAHVSEKNGVMK